MATCIVCNGEYTPPTLICARCGTNNQVWETERTRSGIVQFAQFFLGSAWGILALTSLVLPLVALLLDFQPILSVRIGVPLALLLCFVLFQFTYALKSTFRKMELLSQVCKSRQFDPPMLALAAFSLALILALVVVFTLETRQEADPTQGFGRLLLTIFFALIFVNVTLSAMLMSISDFSDRLNQLVPPPIFLQGNLLAHVILTETWQKIWGDQPQKTEVAPKRKIEAISQQKTEETKVTSQQKTEVTPLLYMAEMNWTLKGTVRALVKYSSQAAASAAGTSGLPAFDPRRDQGWEAETNECGPILSFKLAR